MVRLGCVRYKDVGWLKIGSKVVIHVKLARVRCEIVTWWVYYSQLESNEGLGRYRVIESMRLRESNES